MWVEKEEARQQGQWPQTSVPLAHSTYCAVYPTLQLGEPANTHFIIGSSCGSPWPSVKFLLRPTSKPQMCLKRRRARMVKLCSKILMEICTVIHLQGDCKVSIHISIYTDTTAPSDPLGHMGEHFTQQPEPFSEPSLFLGDLSAPFCSHFNIHMMYNHLYFFFSTNLELKKMKPFTVCSSIP